LTRRTGPPDVLRYSHLGIQFAVVVLATMWLGTRLDRRFSPGTGIFTLTGTFVGAGVGFYFIYRELFRAPRDRSATEKPDSGDSRGDGGGLGSGGGPPDGPPGRA
jgi:hypothetical protein